MCHGYSFLFQASGKARKPAYLVAGCWSAIAREASPPRRNFMQKSLILTVFLPNLWQQFIKAPQCQGAGYGIETVRPLANTRTRQGNRSEFRDEFYSNATPTKKTRGASARRAGSRGRRRKVSIWLPLFGLFFLLCLIAVAGSSAMIWLRKLGTLFGVEWSGDF